MSNDKRFRNTIQIDLFIPDVDGLNLDDQIIQAQIKCNELCKEIEKLSSKFDIGIQARLIETFYQPFGKIG